MKHKNIIVNIGIFIFFGFLGYIFEYLFFNDGVDKSLKIITGFDIPFLPIYSIGAIIIYNISNTLSNTKIPIILKALLYGTILTIYEFLSGIFSAWLFGFPLWNYSNHFLNLKYVSLTSFLFWTILALIFELSSSLIRERT